MSLPAGNQSAAAWAQDTAVWRLVGPADDSGGAADRPALAIDSQGVRRAEYRARHPRDWAAFLLPWHLPLVLRAH